MATVKERLISAYQHDVALYLGDIGAEKIPDQLKNRILNESAKSIKWDELIAGALLTDADIDQLGLDNPKSNRVGIKVPKLTKIPPIAPSVERGRCIAHCMIRTVAIAVVIVSRWMFTLAITHVPPSQGSFIADIARITGTVIDETVYEALRNGLNDAWQIARIICEKSC